jgi:hypothetical protein
VPILGLVDESKFLDFVLENIRKREESPFLAKDRAGLLNARIAYTAAENLF